MTFSIGLVNKSAGLVTANQNVFISEKKNSIEVNERVDKAVGKLFAGKSLTDEQSAWIQYIKEHLIQNLTLNKEDFEYVPIFERHGGWGRFKKLFSSEAETIIKEINAAIAA